MVYLIEKGRISRTAMNDLDAALANPTSVLRHIHLDENVTRKMPEVPRGEVPDLPDRLIAATALLNGVPALSRDDRIRTSAIQTIW